eukprot:gnl/TRDRNA2_/TRDRNA2_139307_c0_seq1.p1 gnl/TRDRNA2_/TRDRNA2_139307_c0~~gnl/TRDRNA2_/TRDRNA2_139307_c0_seq1.p1  ORF type:complete len:191 (-),score=18.35 gnl/TRDRNA2_/TRDRNA2_139307_c0_seq1:88-660(-)
MLAEFFGATVQFQHQVVDIEASWQDAVASLGHVLQTEVTTSSTAMSFVTADLRTCDHNFASTCSHADLYIFAYVCVENARILRAHSFRQLQCLFSAAKLGATFIFLDSSDRLWPSILVCARESAKYEATFVMQCGKVRMLLVRVDAVCESSQAREAGFLKICQDHAKAYEASSFCKGFTETHSTAVELSC